MSRLPPADAGEQNNAGRESQVCKWLHMYTYREDGENTTRLLDVLVTLFT